MEPIFNKIQIGFRALANPSLIRLTPIRPLVKPMTHLIQLQPNSLARQSTTKKKIFISPTLRRFYLPMSNLVLQLETLIPLVGIQVRNIWLLRHHKHNNFIRNKPQAWKINDTQDLTWFNSIIESISTKRNLFFIMRGKPYTRIQFESKPKPCTQSLISQKPFFTTHV